MIVNPLFFRRLCSVFTPRPGNNANFYQDGHTIGGPYYTTVVGDFENSASAYGTFDQGGNLWEWNEAVLYGSSRVLRGGCWNHYSDYLLPSCSSGSNPSNEYDYLGFRVASVPEPGSITLLVCGAVAGLMWWRRRR